MNWLLPALMALVALGSLLASVGVVALVLVVTDQMMNRNKALISEMADRLMAGTISTYNDLLESRRPAPKTPEVDPTDPYQVAVREAEQMGLDLKNPFDTEKFNRLVEAAAHKAGMAV